MQSEWALDLLIPLLFYKCVCLESRETRKKMWDDAAQTNNSDSSGGIFLCFLILPYQKMTNTKSGKCETFVERFILKDMIIFYGALMWRGKKKILWRYRCLLNNNHQSVLIAVFLFLFSLCVCVKFNYMNRLTKTIYPDGMCFAKLGILPNSVRVKFSDWEMETV